MTDQEAPQNDFDKTVKLTPDTPQVGNPTPPAQTPQPDFDKTVKLTPQEDKTVILTPTPAPTPPIPAQAPAPQPAQTAPLIDIAPPPFLAASEEKHSSGKMIGLIATVIILALAWYVAPLVLKNRAEKFAGEGKHAEAAKFLTWALYLYPLNCNSYFVPLGRAQRLSQNLTGAQKSLESVLERKPEFYFAAMREIGFTLKEMGQNQKAFDSFKTYIAVDAEDHEALESYAQLAFQLKDYETSSAAYEKYAGTGKADAEDLYQLGASYFELGNEEKSEQYLTQASEKNKDLKGPRGLLAKIYLSQEKYSEAVGMSKLELSLSPNEAEASEAYAEACWQAGWNALKRKKRNVAMQNFEEGLSVTSKHTAGFNYEIAKIFAQKWKKPQALKHLKAAIAADPVLKRKARRDRAFTSLKRTSSFLRLIR